MSKCVVRMEMPESCKKCKSTICLWVKDDDLDYMDVIEKVQDFRKKNNDVGFPDFCPIICSLPEGHGRLVDADEIMQDIDEDIELDSRGLDDMYITGRVRERLRMDRGYKKGFKEYMRKRPTIVPAERSET